MKSIIVCIIVLNLFIPAWGSKDGGGGDRFVLDFVNVANTEVYIWIKLIGTSLNPQVDPKEFLNAIDPKKIASARRVYESCRFKLVNSGAEDQYLEGQPRSSSDREVEACYDGQGFIYISRILYPLEEKKSIAKRILIAHEIFRKMGVETDEFEVTKQMNTLSISKKATCRVCGPGSSLNPSKICSDSQETDVAIQSTMTLKRMYFNRYSVEIWGVKSEPPRIYLRDHVLKSGAVGQIDPLSGTGYIQLLDLDDPYEVTGTVSCSLN